MQKLVIPVAVLLVSALIMAADADSPMQRHDQIDVVSLSPDQKSVVLSLVETRPWMLCVACRDDLEAKLATYVAFVKTGQLLAKYPQTRGLPVGFRLHSDFPLDSASQKTLDDAKARLLVPLGISLSVSVRAPASN